MSSSISPLAPQQMTSFAQIADALATITLP
jgi:hypothetical protein